MNLFIFTDYVEALKAQIDSLGKTRGFKTVLADAAGCNLSYLSQVLAGKTNLTPDQAFRIAHHLNWPKLHIEYFLLLVNYAQSGSIEHRRYLKVQIDALRATENTITKKVKESSHLANENLKLYYSSWLYQA